MQEPTPTPAAAVPAAPAPAWPGPLHAGDAVALVAPAGPAPEASVRRGRALVESWGLRAVEGPHLFSRDPGVTYLAGTDEDRAADLMWAMTEPGISAVLCVRGGYGCLRILDRLDPARVATAPLGSWPGPVT